MQKKSSHVEFHKKKSELTGLYSIKKYTFINGKVNSIKTLLPKNITADDADSRIYSLERKKSSKI